MLQGGQGLVCDGHGAVFSPGEPHAALCCMSQTGHVGAFNPKEWMSQVALPGHSRHRGGFCFIE